MSTQESDVHERAGAIDLSTVLGALIEKRWWIVTSVFLFTVIFVVAAFLVTPIYRVSTVLISASADRTSLSGSLSSTLGQLGGLASLAGISVGSSDAGTEEALAVLKSRQFTQDFITDRNLMPVLFEEKWDSIKGTWKGDQQDQPTLAQAFKYFDTKIRSTTQDKKTGLVMLQVDWKDGEVATTWADDLVRRLNSEMRNRAIEKVTASIGFLEKELPVTQTVETREAINRLIEAQVKQRMFATVTQEYAFRVVDKAMAPDSRDFIKPQRMLFFVGGPLVGFMIGVFMCIGLEYLRSIRKSGELNTKRLP